ncbi:MAG TPA: hypothetical protein VF477_19290 [Mycobacterium sp.]
MGDSAMIVLTGPDDRKFYINANEVLLIMPILTPTGEATAGSRILFRGRRLEVQCKEDPEVVAETINYA